jgi:hypothetical protein
MLNKNSLQVSSNCSFSLNSANSSAAESRGITSSVGIRTSLPTPVKLTRISKPLSSLRYYGQAKAAVQTGKHYLA